MFYTVSAYLIVCCLEVALWGNQCQGWREVGGFAELRSGLLGGWECFALGLLWLAGSFRLCGLFRTQSPDRVKAGNYSAGHSGGARPLYEVMSCSAAAEVGAVCSSPHQNEGDHLLCERVALPGTLNLDLGV